MAVRQPLELQRLHLAVAVLYHKINNYPRVATNTIVSSSRASRGFSHIHALERWRNTHASICDRLVASIVVKDSPRTKIERSDIRSCLSSRSTNRNYRNFSSIRPRFVSTSFSLPRLFRSTANLRRNNSYDPPC
jgi:hypothetical protein